MNFQDYDSEKMSAVLREPNASADPGGHILLALDTQWGLLEKLQEEVTRLHGKLDPIINNENIDSDSRGPVGPMPPQSNVASAITARNELIHGLLERINLIYRTVDL
jgi:hypothetical protein